MPENKHMDDLEYLAQQGFEKVPASDADVRELVKKVKARSFSYNSGFYFGFISLMLGVFIGASLFFVIYKQAPEVLPQAAEPAITDTAIVATSIEAVPAVIDTVIVKENFVSPQTVIKKAAPEISEEAEATAPNEPALSIPERPISASLFNHGVAKEEQLKFIANAPVMYIHDLKVTNYTLLYFRKNRFVQLRDWSGLPADRASHKIAENNAPHTKQQADYFLHEELAQALLYFKKGKYDRCIATLNDVAAYNDEDINCDFYRGMCYYYKHNYEKAITLFDNCMANRNNTFLQEASFYKATSLYESGHTEEAKKLFKQIAEEDGFYAVKAVGYF